MSDVIVSRLLVVTDWDAGFQLTPGAALLAEVPPGGEYVVECTSPRVGLLGEVVVRDFALDRLYVGKVFADVEIAPIIESSTDRRYPLKPPITVDVGRNIRAVLKNLSDVPKKPKVAMLVLDGQEFAAASRDWSVEGVHVGKAAQPLSPSCQTCDSPDRETRRMIDGATTWCRDAWHGEQLPTSWPEKSVVHAPKLMRTLYEGRGNTTTVRGCSCGAEIGTAREFADHVGVTERAVDTMLGLVGVIYDLCDYPGEVTREEAARRVARCLEFHR
ncbi:MAG TPA: hypothetical protein VLE97_10080 [Gaiellaceae bacterium]|nr:hypothetical protein [Gaiellaceae bacterium]